MEIRIEDMSNIGRGAAFLGTGGGGDPHIGRLLCEQTLREFGGPTLISLEELDPKANVYTIGMMGAPTAMIEKLAAGADADLAVTKLEEHTGRPADAILPVEIGGMNSMIPIAVAARRGLPLIDADGMGRAFPELQMVTFNVYGVPISPFVITNEHMESTIIEARDANSGEDIARAITIRMGLVVNLSCYPMTGADARRTAVRGTMSLAIEIGRAIVRGRGKGNPIDELLASLRSTDYYKHCAVLFDGKITNLEREARRGFSIGRCGLAALDGSGSQMDITFQNESLIARQDGRVRAIVPDLISIVDRDTAEPITIEALKYGQRVKVIGMSAPPALSTPEALAVWGPQCFGLDAPFQPIETLK